MEHWVFYLHQKITAKSKLLSSTMVNWVKDSRISYDDSIQITKYLIDGC